MPGRLEALISAVSPKIDSKAKELQKISLEIWEKPELAYEEHFAHGILSDFFVEEGFVVTKHYTLPTAFRAVFGDENVGPTFAVLCEYDALPVVGHGCGHNLIAIAGVAVALGIKSAIEGGLKARVVAMGTPAEEGGGGKVQMINNGCFEDVDFCMMLHPAPFNVAYYVSQALEMVEVTYRRNSVDNGVFPLDGRNSLDAAVMAYSSISMLRQYMKPTWRVHGIISDGGVEPVLVPEQSKLEFWARTVKNNESAVLKSKVIFPQGLWIANRVLFKCQQLAIFLDFQLPTYRRKRLTCIPLPQFSFIPLPLGISDDLPWGGYGFFLKLHIGHCKEIWVQIFQALALCLSLSDEELKLEPSALKSLYGANF